LLIAAKQNQNHEKNILSIVIMLIVVISGILLHPKTVPAVKIEVTKLTPLPK
jgi:hypothetical protein